MSIENFKKTLQEMEDKGYVILSGDKKNMVGLTEKGHKLANRPSILIYFDVVMERIKNKFKKKKVSK